MVIATFSFWSVLDKVAVLSAFTWIVSSVPCPRNTNSGIFRHQVLPYLGGKIPDSAFLSERLYSNLLNKNGIHTHDGVYFQERHPERHHFPRAFSPNTIKLTIPVNNKHVAKPGRLYKPEIIDTTYLISESVQDSIRPSYLDFQALPRIPIDSLKLAQKARMKQNRVDYESTQIFQKYIPLLEKMHEIFKKK